MEVVGVAADAIYLSLRDATPPTLYVPVAQQPEVEPSMTLSVLRGERAARPAGARSRGGDRAGRSRHRNHLHPIGATVDAALVRERIVAMLSGIFGAVALLLAGLGLYGVTSFTVNRRRAEIGIRMALGATPGRVMRLVLSRVCMVVCLGVLVGLGFSIWVSKLVAPLLYGLDPGDPVTLALSAAVLTTVGVLAGWVPAQRASRVDPADILRDR